MNRTEPTLGHRVQLHSDDSAVGSGCRIWLVIKIGRKWLWLLYPPSLTIWRIRPSEYVRALRSDLGPMGRTTRGVLNRAERDAKLYGWRYSKKALATIREFEPKGALMDDTQGEEKNRPDLAETDKAELLEQHQTITKALAEAEVIQQQPKIRRGSQKSVTDQPGGLFDAERDQADLFAGMYGRL